MVENEKKEELDNQEAFKEIDTTETAEVEVINKTIKKNDYIKLIKEILSYVLIIAFSYLAATIIHLYLLTPVSVEGSSMMPTVMDKDYVLLWRPGEYKRNDIVVFKATSKDYYIKRLIGLPGDYVSMEDDKLFINGVYVEEPYLENGKKEISYRDNFTPNFTLEGLCSITNLDCNVNGEIKIPDGYFLVLGDNRPYSNDSTELGLFKKEEFIGKAKLVLYPFKRFKKL